MLQGWQPLPQNMILEKRLILPVCRKFKEFILSGIFVPLKYLQLFSIIYKNKGFYLENILNLKAKG
jgi:hypothetical protein